MALFDSSIYGIAGLLRGSEVFAMMNFPIEAAALAFLFFNFYPAQVLMGDAGSILLGFFAGIFGMRGWWSGCWPFWLPFLVFPPFMLNATITLLKRVWRKENPGEAPLGHCCQRLIRIGCGHRNVAIVKYFLMFMAGVSALWCLEQGRLTQWVALICWGMIFAVIMMWLDRCWENKIADKKAP